MIKVSSPLKFTRNKELALGSPAIGLGLDSLLLACACYTYCEGSEPGLANYGPYVGRLFCFISKFHSWKHLIIIIFKPCGIGELSSILIFIKIMLFLPNHVCLLLDEALGDKKTQKQSISVIFLLIIEKLYNYDHHRNSISRQDHIIIIKAI